MSETILPSSNSMLTRVSACKPPKRFETPRSSSNAILLSWLPARRQDALGTKDHHQNQDQAEHHALVLRRFELRRQLTQRITSEQGKRQHGTRLTQSVEPERQALEQLQVENRDAGCAENRAWDRAHAAQNTPTAEANDAPTAKPRSFIRTTGTPLAAAATSSSRIPFHARPIRESSNRRVTKTMTHTISKIRK